MIPHQLASYRSLSSLEYIIIIFHALCFVDILRPDHLLAPQEVTIIGLLQLGWVELGFRGRDAGDLLEHLHLLLAEIRGDEAGI